MRQPPSHSEVDFWHDYVAGYEVEASAWDAARNVMRATTGGGLEYAVEGSVAPSWPFWAARRWPALLLVIAPLPIIPGRVQREHLRAVLDLPGA